MATHLSGNIRMSPRELAFFTIESESGFSAFSHKYELDGGVSHVISEFINLYFLFRPLLHLITYVS